MSGYGNVSQKRLQAGEQFEQTAKNSALFVPIEFNNFL